MRTEKLEFDLWLFEKLAEYTAMYHIEAFNKLFENNPGMAEEYLKRCMKELERIELPIEINSEKWKENMLDKIYQAVEKENIV